MSLIPAEGDEAPEQAAIWPVFGDLMACLFGLFVLFFVWAIAFQVDLTRDLQAERAERAAERAERAAERARLEALERALAGPIAEGRITLTEGRIGIRGSILFALNSAELEPEGSALLDVIAPALRAYVEHHDELIMVSGFTDDLPITASPRGYADNWELSAALGVPESALFAAGFGASRPVAPNDTNENRAKNRRVEISPIPRRRGPT